jgi:peptidoglycan hydrolase CwlO-like protein
MDSRRKFLTSLLLVGVSASLTSDQLSAQSPVVHPPQQPQNPQPGQNPIDDNSNPGLPDAEKKMLESNDKDMKKKVEQLYKLASELKEQVEKTDSSKVLNLDLVKKAEEIEKLAHDIKTRSRG